MQKSRKPSADHPYLDLISDLERRRDDSLEGGMQYFQAVHGMLQNDMKKLLQSMDVARTNREGDDEYHFYLRAYCRSVFGLIEGSCAAMQAVLISAHERKEVELTYKEAAILRQEAYALREGEIVPRVERSSVLDRIRFLTSLFARSYRVEFELVSDGLGWRSFSVAEKIRDRLMHPRDHIEYSMTGEECVVFNNAGLWFTLAVGELVLGYHGAQSDLASFRQLESAYKDSALLSKQSVRSNVLRYFDAATPEVALLIYKKMSDVFHRERAVSLEAATASGRLYLVDPNLENLQNVHLSARVLLLSLFAEVNGICALLNRMTLWSHERGDIELSEGERALLEEKRYYLQRGKVVAPDRFNDVRTSLNLAFLLFPRCFGSSYSVDKSTQGWRSFDEALDLRNNLAHPSDHRHVFIETSALRCVSEATVWFGEQMIELTEIAKSGRKSG